MKTVLIVASAVCLLARSPARACAQEASITVAVSISDSTRQLESLFAAALRSLGDVRVVSLAERPTFVVSGVAICDPNCRQLSSYAVALRLYSPVERTFADYLAFLAANAAGVNSKSMRDSIAARLWPAIEFKEQTFNTWVANWGRERYEQAVREFVRRMDTGCFEKHRVMRRMFEADRADSTLARDLRRKYDETAWMC